jgi:tRNA pseudouridine38-40 synthase
MRNIRLQLAFVGSNYCGWQRQKNGISIQQLLEEAITAVTKERVSVTGCSRTDAGVHAEEYVANFRTAASIPAERFRLALQTKLPEDILVRKSEGVAADFHARRDAVEKTYKYQIYLGRSPFHNDRWWQVEIPLPQELLCESALRIVGEHDFSAFCVQKSLLSDNKCRIKEATWRKDGRRLYFQITGNRFLHRMVRFLVGAQVEVATAKMTLNEFAQLIRAPYGRRAKYPAPANGLYLAKVRY